MKPAKDSINLGIVFSYIKASLYFYQNKQTRHCKYLTKQEAI